METYHKIQTVFKRDPDNNFKTLLESQYSLPEFEYLKDNQWIWTEKVDGTNIRIQYVNGELQFNGKTDNAQIPAPLVAHLLHVFDLACFIDAFKDTDACLYGEGYGGKIQKAGATYGPEQRFVLFDVKIGNFWLDREDVEDIALKMRVPVVPIIGQGTLGEMVEITRKGIRSVWGNFEAEGIVARPATELKTRRGERLITKIKTRDFK